METRKTAAAIGYVRVSTDEQGRSGLGLEAQREAIAQAAARAGLEAPIVFEDAGVSGGAALAKRPGLMDALEALKRGGVLIVAKRDRLARSMSVILGLEAIVARKRARIVSAAGEGTEDDGADAVFMRRIMDANAERERFIIAQRTAAAMRAKRRRGEKTGGAHAPFGYDVDAAGRLIANVNEMATLGLMAQLKADGLSVRAIAAQLNEAGALTKTGRQWNHTTVHTTLKRIERDAAERAAATPAVA